MKKKIISILLMGCLVLAAAGCSKKDEEGASTPVFETIEDDEDVVPDKQIADDNVVLGEYKGVEVEVEKLAVTDEDIDTRIESEMSAFATYEEVTDRAVIDGDIANIDYVGSVDGEEFDGGAEQGRDLTIGSGSFIDGFEEQIIGANIGDNFDIYVTFPDPYNSEALAGKDAVFNITVNSIQGKVVPELTDEFVAENTEYSTVEEYQQATYDALLEEKQSTADYNKLNDVWGKILEETEIAKLPMSKVNTQAEFMVKLYETMYGMESDDLVAQLGMTRAAYDQDIWSMAKENVKSQLVVEAIAELENITITDSEYKESLQELADTYSEGDTEAFLESYTEDYIRRQMLTEKVQELVLEAAVVITV